MTLIEEIRNKCSPELLAERNSVAIAAKVSEGRKRIQQPTLIGDGDQAVVNTNTVTVTYTTSLTSS